MSEILTDHSHIRGDLRAIESSIKAGWKIPEVLYDQLATHMGKIVARGSNREKTAAARVLVAMHGQNVPVPLPAQTTINVGVKVEQSPDGGRSLASQIVERIRAERLSGDDPGRTAG